MNALDPCPREPELLDALGRGLVGAELTAHVDACPACTELRMVAGALLDERLDAMAEAPVPAPGTIWWRMQMRQRHDVQVTARRFLFIGQALTLAIAIALTARFFGADITMAVRDVVASIHLTKPVLIALAASLVLAPLGSWVASKP
jgi:hypothetical protein